MDTKTVSKVLLFGVFLFAACNHFTGKPDHAQPQHIPATDTLWMPTGNMQIDSLLQLAATTPPDTTLALLYYKIGDIYENIDFEQAKAYYQKLGNLSEQLDWHKGRILYASGFSLVLMREGLADSALVILQAGDELAKRLNNELWINEMRVGKGTAYFVKQWYETALAYYIEVLPFAEKQFSASSLKSLYDKIAQIYVNISLSEKAIEYGEKSVALEREDPASLFILARAYLNLLQYEKEKEYLEEALRLAALQNNNYLMNLIYYHLASNATMVFDLERAETYARKTMEMCGQFGAVGCFPAILISSKIEQLKGNWVKSEEYVKEALQIAIEFEAYKEQRVCYMILSELSVAQRKYRENIQYWEKFGTAEEAVNIETAIRASEEMFAKYETEKKQLEIERQQHVIFRQNMQYRFLAAVAIVLLLGFMVALLLWRWTVQKKRLSEQQVKQLEQEKQLVATQAVLDGEVQERTRIARDLHDGLGSMLTGSKMNVETLKNDLLHGTLDVTSCNNALKLLNDSSKELRRIAHHLMPDSLARFGLKTAIGDFCNVLPNVSFSWYGNDTRLEQKMEAMIYRTLYELVNNSLKHAHASQILVQIIQEPNRIAFTVQDDGCGFDPSAVLQGTGLQNIRTRVASFGGIMDIVSDNEGTETNVELRIEN